MKILSKGILLAGLLAASLPVGAAAQNASDLESRVKAAFLFNFARFVTWPANKFSDSNAPITLCLSGNDPFGEVLEGVVQDKTVASRSLRVERLPNVSEMRECHIVYFSDPEVSSSTLAALAGSKALVVHEAEQPLAEGVVRFYLEDRRVRFEVNAKAAAREGLQVSSKLLSVARVVNQ